MIIKDTFYDIEVKFNDGNITFSQFRSVLTISYDTAKNIEHILKNNMSVTRVIRPYAGVSVWIYSHDEGFNIEDEDNSIAISSRQDYFDMIKAYEESIATKAVLTYQKPHSCGTAMISSDIEGEENTYMCIMRAGGDRHPDFISIRQNGEEISLSKSEAKAMIRYLTTVTDTMKG